MGVDRRYGGSWAGQPHSPSVCRGRLAGPGEVWFPVGVRGCRPVGDPGSADLWWHLTGIAADRTEPATGVRRGNVDDRHVIFPWRRRGYWTFADHALIALTRTSSGSGALLHRRSY